MHTQCECRPKHQSRAQRQQNSCQRIQSRLQVPLQQTRQCIQPGARKHENDNPFCPVAGDKWAFHLSRYDYSMYLDGGVELSSTALLSKVDFHKAKDWSTLEFVKERGRFVFT